MHKQSKIYVAGHRGLVGSAIVAKLQREGFTNIVVRTHKELDLTRQAETEAFFQTEKPEYVFFAAAKVGGIAANSTYTAQFIYENTIIACNVIHAAYQSGVKKLVNLGSSCIYPKFAPQPIAEESLLTGALEPTNEPYAVAKIAAIKLCRYYNEQYGTHFLSAMPSNLYGPNDNFDLQTSHVLPALIRKFYDAAARGEKSVQAWGDGTPRREFLYSEDAADALVFLMREVSPAQAGEHVNVGTGSDVSIRELAEMIGEISGFRGEIRWDTSKPNGTPRKLMDVSKMRSLGWTASMPLREGVQKAYEWFAAAQAKK